MMRNPFHLVATLFSLLLFNLVVFHHTFAETEGDKWEFVAEKYSVTLHYRPYPNSSIPEFKAVTRIESSMASIIAVLLDSEACAQWVHQCKESFPLHVVNNSEQFVYQVNDLPFAKDRDIILQARMETLGSNQKVKILLNAAPGYCINPNPGCELISDNDYTRVIDSHGFYLIEQMPEDTVQVTWQHYVDPAGKLPEWLAKSQLKNLPLKTLHQLRKIVNQEKYQNTSLLFDEGIVTLVNNTTPNHKTP